MTEAPCHGSKVDAGSGQLGSRVVPERVQVAVGPEPLAHSPDGAIARPVVEVDRTVSRVGTICLGGRWNLAAEILGGRRVTIRIDDHVLLIFDPETRELLRTRPNPLTYDQARRLRGARPAGPPPRPSVEPVTVTRRVSATGTIMIARQLIALGRDHARTVVTAHVAEHDHRRPGRRRPAHRQPHQHRRDP